MTEPDDRSTQAMASAARELFLLGQKTVEARSVLAALQKELSDTNNRLVDAQQIEQLVEANQQLVLAILLAQSEAEKPQLSQEEQRVFLEMREANAQLDRSAQRTRPASLGRTHAGTTTQYSDPGGPRTAQSADTDQHDRRAPGAGAQHGIAAYAGVDRRSGTTHVAAGGRLARCLACQHRQTAPRLHDGRHGGDHP